MKKQKNIVNTNKMKCIDNGVKSRLNTTNHARPLRPNKQQNKKGTQK